MMKSEQELQNDLCKLRVNRWYYGTHYRELANLLGYELADHHTAIFEHYRSYNKTLDLAPRGSGKSTVGSILYSIYRLLQDSDLRILIVSDTSSMAEGFLSEIKQHFESNQWIEKFGEWKGDKWTDNEIRIVSRKRISKEPTIQALGARGSVTSRHVDIIIADDLVDFENARTGGQREKLKQWFRTTLLPVLEPDGQLIILGTRYHPYDFYQDVLENGEYDVRVQRALEWDEVSGGYKSLWPEKWSIEELERTRNELGSIIFNMQYQNDVELAKEGNIFRYEWLQFYSELPANEKLSVYLGVDLAISQKETADYFAVCTIGTDRAGNIYVLDIHRDRLSFQQQIEVIKKKAQQYNPIRIAVESNQYQQVMAQALKDDWLPVTELRTTRDKVTRAQRRSALFESGKVYLKGSMHSFIDELVLFPDSEHDDMFDSFDFACEQAEYGGKGYISTGRVKV